MAGWWSLAVGLLGVPLWRFKSVRLFWALAFIALVGGWRYAICQPRVDEGCLAYYHDMGSVQVVGYVSQDPSVRSTRTQLTLAVEQVILEEASLAVRGNVTFSAPNGEQYAYGDRLHITGALEAPPLLDGGDGDPLAYREYLASQRIYSVMMGPQVERASGPGVITGYHHTVLRWIYAAKRHLRTSVEAILPEPEAGLLSGILLGLGHTLSQDVEEAFRRCGLTHILVISGYNISLVVQSVMILGRRTVSRWVALWASVGVVVLYAVFVGLSAPVLRAALMGVLFVGAHLVGRRNHTLTSLAAASLIMTAITPLALWSVSFQLSFAATLGLIVVEPLLARTMAVPLSAAIGVQRVRQVMRVLRELLVGTLAAQLLTLPIIWYHFGEVSVIALLANILVLFLQPLIMALGFAAMFTGAVWPAGGRVMALAVWPLLRYSVAVVDTLGELPFASVNVPRSGTLWILAMYAAVAGAIWGRRAGLWQRFRAWATGLSLWEPTLVCLSILAVLVWTAVLHLPDGRLHAFFLDVGQGDAILLRSPGGRTILVDGGEDPLVLASRLGRMLPPWNRHIDLVVLTHSDRDHLGGLVPLLARYSIGCILQPEVLGKGDLVTRWNENLAAAGIAPLETHRGDRLILGENLRIDVLHPPAGYDGDINQSSVVLRVAMGDFDMLLTGDIDANAELDIVTSEQLLSAEVLKVAHHGSKSSTSESFLSRVVPQIAVISVGRENRLGHPAEIVLQRLEAYSCCILRTDTHGTVELITDGAHIWIKTVAATD